MPVNLNALIRHRIINRCLQQRSRRWTWKELSAACGDALREQVNSDAPDPAERTIKKDIADMRSEAPLGYSAPIEWDPQIRTYRYADPSFSITGLSFREEDLRELEYVYGILRQFQGFGQAEGMEDIVTRLAHALQQRRPETKPIVQLDYNEQFTGRHWLSVLHRAIDREQCLLVYYKAFHEPDEVKRVVSPYLLKQYNNRWFLIGYEHRNDDVYTLPLDRIRDVEDALLEKFRRIPGFDPRRRYRDVVGVTIPEGGKATEVVIEATPRRADYLRTKPLHQSQREFREGDRFLFRYRLILNYELESRLLSFGEEVEVLQPATLRECIAARAGKMAERYRVG